ncbi:MAG: PBPRA1643 family SWIM/SEC-C metal-binding motif protein [Ferrimonas sp.]
MSKFFYKGKIEKKPKHQSFGYNTKRAVKLGTEEKPLALQVATEARKAEIAEEITQAGLYATIRVVADQPEVLQAWESMKQKPMTTTFDKTPGRNDPCSCGSGQKFKKCCA